MKILPRFVFLTFSINAELNIFYRKRKFCKVVTRYELKWFYRKSSEISMILLSEIQFFNRLVDNRCTGNVQLFEQELAVKVETVLRRVMHFTFYLKIKLYLSTSIQFTEKAALTLFRKFGNIRSTIDESYPQDRWYNIMSHVIIIIIFFEKLRWHNVLFGSLSLLIKIVFFYRPQGERMGYDVKSDANVMHLFILCIFFYSLRAQNNGK